MVQGRLLVAIHSVSLSRASERSAFVPCFYTCHEARGDSEHNPGLVLRRTPTRRLPLHGHSWKHYVLSLLSATALCALVAPYRLFDGLHTYPMMVHRAPVACAPFGARHTKQRPALPHHQHQRQAVHSTGRQRPPVASSTVQRC